MHCQDIRKRLNAWFDGELNQRLSDEIRKHLTICPKCNCVFLDMANLRTVFHQTTMRPLPEGFAGAVMAQVRPFAANKRDRVFQPLIWWRNLTFSLKAASVVAFGLAFSLGVYMGGSFTPANQQAALVSSVTAADSVVVSMIQPFEETGSETIAHAYLTITFADERKR